MTPAARVQAAIDVLDLVIEAARGQGAPADRILADWFHTRRFAGSGDRRAIRGLVYDAIRVCGPMPASGRAALLRLAEGDPTLAECFDSSPYGPAIIELGETIATGGVASAWLTDRLAASGVTSAEAQALLERAPLDIRVNTLKASHAELKLPEPGNVLPMPNGLRFATGTSIERWAEFHDGLIEVQDCGSQLACAAVGAKSGETIIDLCAGAGGKTLALAAAMGNVGTLIAADTDRGRLSRLAPRATRAGAKVAETLLLDPGREHDLLAPWLDRADRVLVDAPCSGTGTWRRNPEARWRLTPAALVRLIALQARLLGVAAALVRPGGWLVYVTCSLLDEEGAEQVDAFLARFPGWRAEAPDLPLGRPRGSGWRLCPLSDQTDGFFIARLQRPW